MDKKHFDQSKFRYKFNAANGIMYKYYYGDLTFQEVISSWEFAIENNIIPKENKGFLLDYRQAKFISPVTEHNIIPEFYQKHKDIFGNHKIAVVTQCPKVIVIPIMIKQKDFGYISEPFSTIEAAIDWILE